MLVAIPCSLRFMCTFVLVAAFSLLLRLLFLFSSLKAFEEMGLGVISNGYGLGGGGRTVFTIGAG